MTAVPTRRDASDAATRRGWCPGLARPMRTGDGLLVRLHPGNGVLSAAQLRAVAAGARAAGNGLVDVTARGNLQIRGVQPGLHPRLAAALAAVQLGDARPPGGPRPEGPQRLTLAAPLAGLDPAARLDAFALAAAIEAAAVDLAGLHPKLLVVVADGSRATLDGVDADLHLAPDAAGAVILTLAGEATAFALPVGDPADTVRTLLSRLTNGGPCRVRDLAPRERAALLAGLGLPMSAPSTGGKADLVPGLHDLGPGGVALVLELPFGRGDAALLDAVTDWAEAEGDGAVRLTPARGLVLPHLREAEAVHEAACRHGLIVAPDDPRRAVAACPGAPACASGHAPAQADAARLAAMLPAGSRTHVSGCAKGCAHPGPADLTLVGLPEGGYGIVPGGTARDAPVARLSLDAIRDRLAGRDGAARAKPFAALAQSA